MRNCRKLFFILTTIFVFSTLATARPAKAAEDTCKVYELNPVGGVTRGNRFDIPIELKLPSQQFYCNANQVPPLDTLWDDAMNRGCTAEEWNDGHYMKPDGTRADCVYVLTPTSTCPDPTLVPKILETVNNALKENEVKVGSGENNSSNVRNEADFHEVTNVKLRTPTQAGDASFVTSTTGETARKPSECKVYYAACFKVVFPLYKWDNGKWVQDTKITTGWFTQTKDDPLHCETLPSFKKEANITENLQTSITQVPGLDPAITKLKKEEPRFNEDGTVPNNDQTDTTQADFPKMELRLASRRVDTSSDKYLIYWKLCTAKGTNSCDIKNFVADLEEVSSGPDNGQVKVATTPNVDWGDSTSTGGGNTKCFITEDFNTHPIEVKKSEVGDYYTLKAKIVGQPSDSADAATAHCQNSAEVMASVPLDENISQIPLSYSLASLPKIAACPDTDVKQQAKPDTETNICIMGSCFIGTISRIVTGATNYIKSYFDKTVTYDSPKATRINCDSVANSFCDPKPQVEGKNITITQTVTPSNFPPNSGMGQAHVAITVTNASKDEGTNVLLGSQWLSNYYFSSRILDGLFTTNQKGFTVADRSSNAITWRIDALAPESSSTFEYDIELSTSADIIYKLKSFVTADIVSEKTTSASYEDASILVADDGTLDAPRPTSNKSPEGLEVYETFEGPGSGENTAKVTVAVKNGTNFDLKKVDVQSLWDNNALTGASKQFSNVAKGATVEFSYTANVDNSSPHVYIGQAIANATYDQKAQEGASIDQVAVQVGNNPGGDLNTICKRIVWFGCYLSQVLGGMNNNTYTQTINVHYYPYFSTAYTGQLQKNAVSPKDGYFNFATPPNDETKPTPSEQKLSTTTSQTKDTTYPLKGQLPDKSGINDLFKYLTPPGQKQPEVLTAKDDPWKNDGSTPVTFSGGSSGESSGGGDGGFGDDGSTDTPRQINTKVKVDEANKQRVIEYVMNRWPNSKIAEKWDYVYNKALSMGYNPGFIIALWIEESGASHYTNAWDFGCTSASKYNIDSGLSCLNGLLYKDKTWEEFSCRYSEGHFPCVYDINTGFPRAIGNWYQRVVFGIWP